MKIKYLLLELIKCKSNQTVNKTKNSHAGRYGM